MNYIHFTFENIFDYQLVLERIPKDNWSFSDLVENIDLLQLTISFMYASEHYKTFIASICNCPYEVTTTTVCDS